MLKLTLPKQIFWECLFWLSIFASIAVGVLLHLNGHVIWGHLSTICGSCVSAWCEHKKKEQKRLEKAQKLREETWEQILFWAERGMHGFSLAVSSNYLDDCLTEGKIVLGSAEYWAEIEKLAQSESLVKKETSFRRFD